MCCASNNVGVGLSLCFATQSDFCVVAASGLNNLATEPVKYDTLTQFGVHKGSAAARRKAADSE